MKRRQMLTGVGSVAAVAATSGCLGYGVVSTSDIEDRKETIADLRETVQQRDAKVSQLESRITSLEDRIGTLNQTLEKRETELEELTAERNSLESQLSSLEAEKVEARRKQLFYLYDLAYRLTQVSDGDFTDAGDEWEAENYQFASRLFASAYAGYDSARGACSDIVDLADARSWGSARDAADEAATALMYWRDASNHYSSAAINYANGYYDEGDSDYDKAVNDHEKAQSYTIIEPSKFRDELGLSANTV